MNTSTTDELQRWHNDAQASRARHAAVPERVRGLHTRFSRRGEMSIPAFKLTPGGDPLTDGRTQSLRLMAGASKFAIDLAFFDLEDAAPDQPQWKTLARRYCIEALQTLDFGQRVIGFRPNNIRTAFFVDDVCEVLTAAGNKVQVLVIPKTETADEVRDIARLVRDLSRIVGLERPPVLEVLIESPRAFAEAQQIAAIPEVGALVFGAYDFARCIGSAVDAQTWLDDQRTVRQLLPVLAASEGKEAVDAITATLPLRPQRPEQVSESSHAILLQTLDEVALQDLPETYVSQIRARHRALALAERDARDAARLGYAAKWVLHPDQIAAIQGAFTPTEAAARAALALVAGYAQAAVTGSGAEVHSGELVDKAVAGAMWWQVRQALQCKVLADSDITATGFSWAELARTTVTRDDQL
jgi:citrate lyase beta subunit